MEGGRREEFELVTSDRNVSCLTCFSVGVSCDAWTLDSKVFVASWAANSAV